MAIFLIFALCLAVAAFVLLPLRAASAVNATAFQDARENSGRKTLVEQQRTLSRQIKDLEFDNSLGKLDAADYDQWRTDLNERLTSVKTRLQEAPPATSSARSSTRYSDFDLEAEILIARARRKRAVQSLSPENSWTCACGRTMSDEDRFCASCGSARS